jgi:tRNA (guanine-N7-)-methyltransferase
MLDPADFIITRKRKKYKFALYANSPICFEYDEWQKPPIDVLEVGAGTGHFGVALAEYSPHEQFVAFDVKADRLQQGAKNATDKNLSNIRFLRARADQLPELFPPHSIGKIWVTFPDPFPRERSAKRRLTHTNFLDIYAGLLKPSGELYFKTDARNLFDWSLEQLVSNGWTIKELSFDLHESVLASTYKIETTYEARYRKQGIKINFVRAVPPVSH